MGHLIHRQILELRFSSQEAAQHWTVQLSEQYQQIILSELDRVFTEVGKGQTVRIDRLEIDLGQLRQAGLNDDLAGLVRQKIHEALLPYLLTEHVSAAESSDKQPGLDEEKTGGDEEPEQALLDSDSLVELFKTFLQTGQFPWWLKRELTTQLDRLYQQFWRQAPDAARAILLQTISGPVGLQRFVEQFSNRSHQLTLQQLLPTVTGELLIDLRKLVIHLLARQGFGLQARRISFKLVYGLIVVSDQQQLEWPQSIVRKFFFTLTQISGIPTDKLHEEVDAAVARLRMMPATMAVLAELLREKEDFGERRKKLRDFEPSLVTEEDKAEDAVPQTDPEMEIVVENAGLVLLWPHLKEFLHKLDLLETLDEGSQRPKVGAVLLLQQLATGQPAGQENLLALNKLLCGIPQTAPVLRRQCRTAQWDAEVEALLTAVIKQWSVLKNTSVDGLRSGFLQRDGILREQGQGWTLQVERKAQDVLLEQLPWGVGMVQFSWMQQPLLIEW